MTRSIIRSVFVGLILVALAASSFGQIAVGVSVRFGPPAIPVYAQPICPGPGYFWTPGYWAWDDDGGYYWVPGTWVVAPVGMLWTPGYWGWGGGYYAWHAGYWGPHVGFYGGINYGFGYTGFGFGGGEWRGRDFYYNRSVTNVSVTNVTNVYNRTVIVKNENRVSYNGGQGGLNARPSPQEERFAHERHTAALSVQSEHERSAIRNRENFAAQNHGRPAIAATARPGDFSSHSVVPARNAGGEYHAPTMSPREARVGGPGAGNRSNDGFRPFTPPSKGGAAGDRGRNNGNFGGENRPNQNRNMENRGTMNRPNENRMNENRPNQSRPNENRMNENRPNQSRPNENRMNENRPNQSRPNENRMNETRPNQSRPNEMRPNDSRPNQTRPNESRPNEARSNQSRPQNESRPAQPRMESRPNAQPAPQHEQRGNPPKEEKPRGKGR